jgi:hypothetical protein
MAPAALLQVNPTLAGDNNAVLQPGQRINIPPFTADCGEGEPHPAALPRLCLPGCWRRGCGYRAPSPPLPLSS